MPDRLEALHQRIDDLTAPDGDFAVVCPDSGKRPVPVKGLSFPTPEAAEDAADLVREYREVLREVDPYLERLTIAPAETAADPLRLDVGRERVQREYDRLDERRDRTDRAGKATRSITVSGDRDGEWLRLDDAPVVRVREDGDPLDDAAVERQLKAKL